jgi:hypothetical protein
MVQEEDQNILLGTEAHEFTTQQGRARQIERRPHLRPDSEGHFGFTLVRIVAGKVHELKLDILMRMDHLKWSAAMRAEAGAERLMAA